MYYKKLDTRLAKTFFAYALDEQLHWEQYWISVGFGGFGPDSPLPVPPLPPPPAAGQDQHSDEGETCQHAQDDDDDGHGEGR